MCTRMSARVEDSKSKLGQYYNITIQCIPPTLVLQPLPVPDTLQHSLACSPKMLTANRSNERDHRWG
jgi:hypothetical protein